MRRATTWNRAIAADLQLRHGTWPRNHCFPCKLQSAKCVSVSYRDLRVFVFAAKAKVADSNSTISVAKVGFGDPTHFLLSR